MEFSTGGAYAWSAGHTQGARLASRSMWICLCRAVNARTVCAAIQDGGARTVREIAATCGAGADCTKCTPTIRRLLKQELDAREGAT